jgi:hypothetical protein
MNHVVTLMPGTDARNWVARCTCGWGHSNTFVATNQRSVVHEDTFANYGRMWNDPYRMREMPPAFAETQREDRGHERQPVGRRRNKAPQRAD